jgi:hypothetical protein
MTKLVQDVCYKLDVPKKSKQLPMELGLVLQELLVISAS